jgi:hypothetical protein
MGNLRSNPTAITSWPQDVPWTPDAFSKALEASDIALPATPYGRAWFVDTNTTVSGGTGETSGDPFTTMAAAFAVISSGDTIYFRGNINEQLTSPTGAADITIIGAGNRPRHADTHPLHGEVSASTWKIGALGNNPLLIIRNPGWRIINVLFAAHASNYALRLERTGVEDATEQDASHLEVIGCRFASGAGGISDTGGCFNVRVANCHFQGLTTACILGVGNIGVGQLAWEILDNHFNNFTNGVKIAAHECLIRGNFFTDGGTPNTTFVLNTNNGGGRDNFVVENFFQTLTANFNTPDVVGCATDVWAKNVSFDATSAGVGGNMEFGQPA